MKTFLLFIGGYFALNLFLNFVNWLLVPLSGILGPLLILGFIVGLIVLGRAVTR
jgi:hypothetical protein